MTKESHRRLWLAPLRHLLLLVLAFPLLAWAGLSVSPAYLFLDLSKSNPSGAFTISNITDQPEVFRARTTHFALTEGGGIQPSVADDYSLAEWIKFNPKEFTLPAKSSRLVRFTVVPPRQNLKPREYWGAIEFIPLTAATFSSEDKEGRKMEFKVVTTVLIPIYGRMPDIPFQGRLSSVGIARIGEQTALSALVENTGEGILRMAGSWQIFAKTTGASVMQGEIDQVVVLPKQKRALQIVTKKSLPAGEYIASFTLEHKRAGVLLSGSGEGRLP